MESLFEKIMNNPEYQKHLKKLPEDERKAIQESLRQLAEQWEANILKPLQSLK